MVTRDELFPSKYLKAADLAGKPWVLKIKAAPIETLKDMRGGESRKCVLHFVGVKKSMPLNMTNFVSVAEIAGDDTDMWPGHEVQLYPSRTQMAGETVDCVRIRKPPEPGLSLVSSRAPAPAPKPAPTVPATTDEDDMADKIPF
jgi:hypothetical protein